MDAPELIFFIPILYFLLSGSVLLYFTFRTKMSIGLRVFTTFVGVFGLLAFAAMGAFLILFQGVS